jgi:hypothetical protein
VQKVELRQHKNFKKDKKQLAFALSSLF